MDRVVIARGMGDTTNKRQTKAGISIESAKWSLDRTKKQKLIHAFLQANREKRVIE